MPSCQILTPLSNGKNREIQRRTPSAMPNKQIIILGIEPSGLPHIGAVRHANERQKTENSKPPKKAVRINGRRTIPVNISRKDQEFFCSHGSQTITGQRHFDIITL